MLDGAGASRGCSRGPTWPGSACSSSTTARCRARRTARPAGARRHARVHCRRPGPKRCDGCARPPRRPRLRRRARRRPHADPGRRRARQRDQARHCSSPARCWCICPRCRGGSMRRRSRAPGFAAALVKPVRPSALLDVLDAAWKAHRAGTPSPVVTRAIVAGTARRRRRDSGAPARRRALVVEDDTTNQRVAVKLLEKLGWQRRRVGQRHEARSTCAAAARTTSSCSTA